jgi:peptide/nickel transport system substrate-binding protein
MRPMTRRVLRGVATAALAAGLSLGAVACGGDDEAANTGAGTGTEAAGEATKGGVYRMATPDLGHTAGFDPSAEYLGVNWGYYSNLLVRTLMTYNHAPGPEGTTPVPDLATAPPEVSADGLTYTYRLKDGIRFGPPVDREITSQDIAYAFERLATPSVAAGYANYYSDIEGFSAFGEGDAETISGITTPDDKTISFTFTKKLGDVDYRMAMPATGPIPEEVAKCHTGATEYGRYVIASGPYMLEGSDKLNIGSCAAQKPIAGHNPDRRLSFVRNPNYDPATDSPEIRENNVDGVEVVVNTNIEDIFDRIDAGDLDDSPDAPPGDVIRRYTRDEALQERLKINAADRTWYLAFNLTEKPFDDVNVRKAVNFVMDKEGLRRAWGGSTQGEIATKTVPDTVYEEAFTNEEYDPYPSEGFAGDVEAAKEAMRQSPYDTDKDGVCDAPQCKSVFMVTRNYGAWAAMQPVIEESLRKIGITVDARELPIGPAYNTTQTPSRKVALMGNHGWGKDYADPSTFAVLHDSRNILKQNNSNVSLVGLTPEKAREIGVDYPEGGVPNVDADIDRCIPLTGQERTDCYIALDKKLMEEIVPWVPYLDAANVSLVSEGVTKWEYDQFSNETALSKVAVDPTRR